MSETGMRTIYKTVEFMQELEGQDQVLVLDMSQAMLWDLWQTGAVRGIYEYVRQYCDLIDGPGDAVRIAYEINKAIGA